jgi:hypothetical protein
LVGITSTLWVEDRKNSILNHWDRYRSISI